MSLVTIWSPHFQSQVRMRGRSYQLAGRVKRLDPTDGETVRAEVRGRETYDLTITAEGRHAAAECSCPAFNRGAFCKHLWALLLDIQQNDSAIGQQLSKLRVRSPKARKRDTIAPLQRSREPEWIGRLSLLRPPQVERPAGNAMLAAQRQVCYVVLSQPSARHGGLVIALRQRTASASGWSRAKPMKLGPTTLVALADPTDRELCAIILGAAPTNDSESSTATYRYERAHETYCLPPGAWRTVLLRMIETGRCYVDTGDSTDNPQETALQWDGNGTWVLWLVAQEVEDQLVVNMQLRRDKQHLAIDEPELILGGADGLLIAGGKVAPFDDRDAYRWVSQFREDFYSDSNSERPLHVPMAEVPQFVERLYMLPQLPEIDLPAGLGRIEQHVEPVPHLDLFGPDSAEAKKLSLGTRNQLVANVWLAYGDRKVDPIQPGRFVPSAPAPEAAAAALVRRDLRREQEAVAQLAALGFRQVAGSDSLLLPARQMSEAVTTLLGHGWIIRADQRTVRQAGPPSFVVKTGLDWFELRGGMIYRGDDGHEYQVDLPQILAAVRAGSNVIELGDGSKGLLPEKWLSEHGLLTSMGSVEADHLRFKQSQVAMLDALLDEKELASVDRQFAEARQRLAAFEGIQPLATRPQFRGTLRSYQCDGLGWFAFLRWFGVGGILADDMGLGKTVQVLAMLQARRSESVAAPGENLGSSTSGQPPLPSLVVVPRSVVFNWVDEAERFTPDLKVLAYTGTDRAAMLDAFGEYNMIVTSYGLIRRDIEQLRHQKLDYVVLDEAQAIKNPGSLSAKAVRLLDAQHRLALTGTPIENHVGDLWSIFEFLNPGMLGASSRFNELMRNPPGGARSAANTRNGDHNHPKRRAMLEQIAASLRPFILRRTKKQVLSDLPPKTEQTLVCEMEPEQRRIYDELRLYYRGSLMNQLDRAGATAKRGVGNAAFIVLEALLRLRQAACHPGLIDKSRQDHKSAKLDVLLDRLADIIDEGSKALVFSQFTSMLALVKPHLDARDIPYCYLDGQTRDRKQVVQQFQTDEQIPVFLISLKAGGFGLNLTAAEYVFILDPWWNPAVEAQAIDRTHRIGQTKPVFAYRMICQDTVEQRIAELQAQKKQLADAIVGGEQTPLKDLTREDLEMLLS